MRPSVELGNPFTPEQPLNASDVHFIGEVLGPEAQEIFRSLGNDKANTATNEESLDKFALTEQEARDIDWQLPTDFWSRVDEVTELWQGVSADPDQLHKILINPDVWKGFELTSRQMQTLCNHIVEFKNRVEGLIDAGYLFSQILNHAIAALPVEEKANIHLKIGENEEMDQLGWRWADGTLEITAPAGNLLGEEMGGGRIIGIEGGLNVGAHMIGGTLEVGKVGNSCGNGIFGGLIVIDEAGDNLGCFMRGGEIRAQTAAADCGFNMSKGTIIVGEADIIVGSGMGADATIRILKKVSACSKHRTGHIFRPDGTEVAIGEEQ